MKKGKVWCLSEYFFLNPKINISFDPESHLKEKPNFIALQQHISFLMSDRKIILGLIILQLVICLPILNQFPIALDEPFSIFHSQQPILEFWKIFEHGNNPPLHFLLLHVWIKLFGISAFSVRSLSVLFSLVSLVFVYKFGRKFWSKEFAVLLAGLFIFSRINHLVAMEARMYGLFTLFFILILYDFYALIFEDKPVYIRLGIWNALLLYSHYLGGAIVFMEIILFVAYYKKWTRSKIKHAFITTAIGVMLYLPVLTLFLNRATDYKNNGTWVAKTDWSDLWVNFIKFFNNELTFFSVIGLLILFYFICEKKSKHVKTSPKYYFSIWFFGTYFLLFFVSVIVQPLFIIRYTQFLSIPLYAVIIGFIAHLQQEKNVRFMPFLILLPFIFSMKIIPDLNRNTDDLVEYVIAQKNKSATVYFCPPHYVTTIAYHYDQRFFSAYKNTDSLMEQAGFIPIDSGEKINRALNEIIYVDFESDLLYPGNNILNELNAHYFLAESATFKGGFTVYTYKKD